MCPDSYRDADVRSYVIGSVAKQSPIRKESANVQIPASRDKACECADACPTRMGGCRCGAIPLAEFIVFGILLSTSSFIIV
jgi:hypothetical protein